eukprot:gene34732-42057_t
MLNVALLGVGFGFSSTFYMAVLFRFLIGLGNGFMGIAKTVVTEITHNKQQEIKAFGIINGVWGLGPAIGGFLARPHILYPSLQIFNAHTLWASYPYLLPSLVCSLIALISAIGIGLYLPETLVIHPASTPASPSGGGSYERVRMDESSHGSADSRKYGWTDDKQKQAERIRRGGESGDEDEEVKEASGFEMVPLSNLQAKDIEEGDSVESPAQEESCSDSKQEHPATSLPATFQEIIYSPQIQFLFVLYWLYCFTILYVDETFPLWSVSSIYSGGLDWGSTEVGETLAMVGGGLIFFQLFLYERTLKMFCAPDNPVQTYARCVYVSGVCLTMIPFVCDSVLYAIDPDLYKSAELGINVDTKTNLYLRASVTAIWLLYRLPAAAAFTILAILTNGSVDPRMRGTMNGLIMTAGSLGNASGPIIGSAMYAWLLNLTYGNEDGGEKRLFWPRDGRLVFVLGGLLAISLGALATRFLKKGGEQ